MRLCNIAVLVMLTVCGAAAQSPNEPSKEGIPKVTIELEPGIRSEQVDIRYSMEGDFGGHSSFVRHQPDLHEYVIDASVGNKPARNIIILVYAPGCQFSSFDLVLTPNSGMEKRHFGCQPLRNVPITGYIDPHELPADKPLDVVAEFEADWMCRYFNLMDCLVPSVSLGTVGTIDPARAGEFELTVPDFVADPVISSVDEANGADKGSILFVLKDKLLGRTLAAITPKNNVQEQRGLNLQRAYPSPVVFTVVH